jgi:hypothetical protein
LKHTREATIEHNLKRKTTEHYHLFAQMLAAGEGLSAYAYLGNIFQSLAQMEPEQRTHYTNVIAGHRPTGETFEVLRSAYEHNYRRALQLAAFSPNLTGEDVDLIRQLRDDVYSVHNLLDKAFSIPLTPLTELDQAILKNLERYFRKHRNRS